MKDMYGAGAIIGGKRGLLPLYDQLAIIFRSTIAPSGGNNDNIVAPLANLLCLAKKIVENENPEEDFTVDVMHFIFRELYDSLVSGYTIPYAPYIMMLIKDTLKNHNFSRYDMEPHPYKKVYQKRKEVIPSSAVAAPARGSFMGDARRGATGLSLVPSFAPPKKLNWFQRNILCMNADIRRGQYDTYLRQENILKHLPRLPNDPPESAPLSFAQWNVGSQFPWTQLESHLLETASAGPSRPSYTRDRTHETSDRDGDDTDDDDTSATE